MAKQSSKKEYMFSDLVHEVHKLNTAQFANGKDSAEYKKQHAKSVEVVKELNSVYGHGYASLSKTRGLIQSQYVAEKEKAKEGLAKAMKNKRGK